MREARRQASDEMPVHVTQHAIERYAERTWRRGNDGRLASEIMGGVRRAVDLGHLFAAGGPTYLAPVPVPARSPACAVLDVRGPAEKPFAVTVCTVLTMSIAMATFRHVPGLVPAMAAAPLLVA